MKKTIFLLIPLIFILQNCIDIKADNYTYKFELPAENWVTISPKKDVYKVGDTVNIIYKIPSKVGKYAIGYTGEKLQKEFGTTVDNFMLHSYNKSNTLSVTHLNFITENYNTSNSNSQTIKVLINDNKFNKRDPIMYKFDESSKMYVMKVTVVFLTPNILYWEKDDEKSNSLLHFSFGSIGVNVGESKNAYSNDFLFKYKAPNNNIAIRVIE